MVSIVPYTIGSWGTRQQSQDPEFFSGNISVCLLGLQLAGTLH